MPGLLVAGYTYLTIYGRYLSPHTFTKIYLSLHRIFKQSGIIFYQQLVGYQIKKPDVVFVLPIKTVRRFTFILHQPQEEVEEEVVVDQFRHTEVRQQVIFALPGPGHFGHDYISHYRFLYHFRFYRLS